jgi:polyhydroxybutyrate depolymerase
VWRRLAILSVACGLLAAGCGGPRPATGPSDDASASAPSDGAHTIDVKGVSRTYLLHEPAAHTGESPLPLVIALHSYPGSGATLRSIVGLDAKADRHGFLVAYPDGQAGGFNALVCCGSADDVAFLQALTQHLIGTGRVDPDRVYVTGISNGGDMTFRAAVELSELFAAVAVVSGGYIGPRTEEETYVPTAAISVLAIIGSEDRYFTSFQAGLATWHQRLRCVPSTAAATSAAVARTTARCGDGSDVDTYVVDGMGHAWPGAHSGSLAAPDAPIVATDVLWDFFAAHPRRS